jgi:hypothetical protein
MPEGAPLRLRAALAEIDEAVAHFYGAASGG